MKNKKAKQTPTALKITDKAKGNVFISCEVNGAVEIDKEAKDNKFIDTDITVASKSEKKEWHETALGRVIIGVIIGVIVLVITLFANQYLKKDQLQNQSISHEKNQSIKGTK